MSDGLAVGVSPRTIERLSGVPAPGVRWAVLSGTGKAADRCVTVLWRRQWDRTAWVTAAIDDLPGLRWVHTDTAGVDRLPLAVLAERGILLTNARGAHTAAVAEWALGAMLVAARQFDRTITDAAQRRWSPHRGGLLLQGRTVMVLGLGDIGRHLARACAALGMRVLGTSRSGRLVPGVEVSVSDGPWRERLGEVSFLVDCLPLTRQTRDLVDAALLSRLPASAVLINVGRGETVVEADLCAAVRAGRLRGAVLDTVRTEPLPDDDQLWRCPGVLVSPHESGFCDQTEPRTRALFVEELTRHLDGRAPLNFVDLDRGY
ncbi:D-2-hydroxyacid dehydrogenase [Actinotalea solisilvae]|uniref:D-2-hydroxyacid dehydrogenase n=1 Tax=Actinotalea solisilvae TaxID=2072922 RepID=UPI0018F2584A|nr:D-2-hydroxyacid dehydrogenase [Actinotalea solisilvae]